MSSIKRVFVIRELTVVAFHRENEEEELTGIQML